MEIEASWPAYDSRDSCDEESLLGPGSPHVIKSDWRVSVVLHLPSSSPLGDLLDHIMNLSQPPAPTS